MLIMHGKNYQTQTFSETNRPGKSEPQIIEAGYEEGVYPSAGIEKMKIQVLQRQALENIISCIKHGQYQTAMKLAQNCINELITGEFVTAKLFGEEDCRQGWIISQSLLKIKGQSGKEHLCEGDPVRVINPPPKERKAK